MTTTPLVQRVADALMVLRSEEHFLRVVHGENTADDHAEAINTLEAALDALARERDAAVNMRDAWSIRAEAHRQAAERAEAEAARLREALEQIESIDCTCENCRAAITNYARAALTPPGAKS